MLVMVPDTLISSENNGSIITTGFKKGNIICRAYPLLELALCSLTVQSAHD